MAQYSFEEFCGSAFWDTNLTWNTERPSFTPCFQKTVLAWAPIIFLKVFSLFDIYFIVKSKNNAIPWNRRNISKIIVLTLNGLSCTTKLLYGIEKWIKNSIIENVIIQNVEGPTFTVVDLFTPLLKLIATTIVMMLTMWHRKKGIRSSGLIFLYWFLTVVCGIPQLCNVIQRLISGGYYDLMDITYIIYNVGACLSLLLNCFADTEATYSRLPNLEKTCPENSSSFPSRIFFTWFDGLAKMGFKKSLEKTDLWNVNFEDRTRTIASKFEKHWHNPIGKNTRKNVSILQALCKAFGFSFFFGCLLKLADDLMTFINPELLKLLIDFVNGNEPLWHGYFYAVSLLVVATLQTLVVNIFTKQMMKLGLEVRTALISTIYKKTLRLSNAARKESTTGEIVNLMSVDSQRFMDIMPSLHLVWSCPLKITLSIYFLWQTLGPSVMTGVAVMVAMIPINVVIAKKLQKAQVKQMVYKDNRVKIMNEILSGIKVLKLNAWESAFEKLVKKIRNEEAAILKKMAYFNATTAVFLDCTPFLVSVLTFTTFVYIDQNNVLDAKKAFVSLTLFGILSFPLSTLTIMITELVQAWVSLKRISKFMNSEELDPDAVSHDEYDPDPLVMHDGSFHWGNDDGFALKNITMRVNSNSLVAVVGPVGSGKSSLLSAFLGEMVKTNGHGAIAYVSQESWIQNATLKDNILLGKPFDRKRYDEVIAACALEQDLKMLPGGDLTEIGEKGINLSGGQKQRVSLARAVYYNSDVYFFDDPLSAVDSHVGKHIFQYVLGPKGILQDKVDNIVVLKNGTISEMGSYDELLNKKGAFADFLNSHLLGDENLQESESNEKCLANPDQYQDDFIIKTNNVKSRTDLLKCSREISVSSQEITLELPPQCHEEYCEPDIIINEETGSTKFLQELSTSCIETSLEKPAQCHALSNGISSQRDTANILREISIANNELCLEKPSQYGEDCKSITDSINSVIDSANILRELGTSIKETNLEKQPWYHVAYRAANIRKEAGPSKILRELCTSSNKICKEKQLQCQEDFRTKTTSIRSFTDLAQAFREEFNVENQVQYQEEFRSKTASISSESSTSKILRRQSRASCMEDNSNTLDDENIRLIEDENTEVGKVKWKVYKHYLRAIGPFVALTATSSIFMSHGLLVSSSYWLSVWATDTSSESTNTQNSSKLDKYLGVYAALGIARCVAIYIGEVGTRVGAWAAACRIHDTLLSNVLRAPLSFTDTNPTGRILSRFSNDVDTADNTLPWIIYEVVFCSFEVIATLGVISYTTPMFISIIVPLSILYFLIQLKRLESVSRSPIYSHFSESITGSNTIRAFGATSKFIEESEKKVDDNQACVYPGIIANRWLAVRLGTVGNFVIFLSALLGILSKDVTKGLIGLSVSFALQITNVLNYLVRTFAQLEINMVSVERIKEYSETPQEAPWTITPEIVGEDWPSNGTVELSQYKVRYRDGLDLVLKGISLKINAGEKIGIVGRTGAGKSSLTLGIFRIIEAAAGKIYIDDVDISKLGLHSLRSRLTIIPQDPVLFTGTLRFNLDPSENFSDEQVWNALEMAHLKTHVTTLPNKLQYEVSEGGSNFSVGQRQLMCLARALLRKTKILVLDEATAAVDLETDDLIQRTIRREFQSCTVLTIAHRINTIMDSDRVLVLVNGLVSEFDSPDILLKNEYSEFYSLAKDAGLVN